MAGGMQGRYTPPAPARRPGNNGLLLWSLIGCGVIALLVVIIAGVLLSKGLKSGDGKNFLSAVSAMPTAAENVAKVGSSLEDYKKDNNGKYPPNLEAMIPKYVADKSAFTSGGDDPHPMEYTMPKPDAEDNVVVLRIHVGDIVIPTQRQKMSVILLKNGEIDQEQVARTIMTKASKHVTDHKSSR